jgi:O-acetyl-ADP-ribose deacetylase (regulator of RNase III)
LTSIWVNSEAVVKLQIVIQQGSILEAAGDAIVNAANSQGWMGGGVAGAIKRVAGREVEEEAVARGPTPVGEAILTSGGKTRFRGIIHAPTMERPAMRIAVEKVEMATKAALRLAEAEGFATIALPGMGTGVGGVDHEATPSGSFPQSAFSKSSWSTSIPPWWRRGGGR